MCNSTKIRLQLTSLWHYSPVHYFLIPLDRIYVSIPLSFFQQFERVTYFQPTPLDPIPGSFHWALVLVCAASCHLWPWAGIEAVQWSYQFLEPGKIPRDPFTTGFVLCGISFHFVHVAIC